MQMVLGLIPAFFVGSSIIFVMPDLLRFRIPYWGALMWIYAWLMLFGGSILVVTLDILASQRNPFLMVMPVVALFLGFGASVVFAAMSRNWWRISGRWS